ncbi:putative lipoyltransferase 2, mitochondrial [Limulus polyphemus]|uniref:Octanoyl-[acyl-carrier-protein]:protein N-octanoyltransferase LIPT2, mitochondrial n=1 Tax=Limulus polyphemus TaxID=6850 RepID=A0ABM1AZR4_LIMPO|nr:putative lipoyltransferase 2, mitochondrial [Limulus polyphemus]
MISGKPVVVLKKLGYLAYQQALTIQKKLVQQLHDSLASPKIPLGGCRRNFLLLVEHEPVYTVGIRSSAYTASEEQKLRALGADFVRTNRGGLITFHGPGQLVAYPILYLGDFSSKKSMRWYVYQLEQCIIHMCKYYGIQASTSPYTGVWVKEKKIAAIGIHGSRYVTSHGVAINCNTDMSWFHHIVPCGIPDKGVTSLSQELGKNISVTEATTYFIQAFEEQFKCTVLQENMLKES